MTRRGDAGNSGRRDRRDDSSAVDHTATPPPLVGGLPLDANDPLLLGACEIVLQIRLEIRGAAAGER